MAQPHIQHSFHAGEFAPALNARVDLAKYHSAAALMRNYFVDYRGGASSRMGTKYVIQVFNTASRIRLIPFQASFTVTYVLEFGDGYIRFITNGAPVLEPAVAITGASQTNPAVLSVVNTYSAGDWLFITGVNGMTQLNQKYVLIISRTPTTITLGDIKGGNFNATGFSPYISGGTVQRVYKIASTFAGADVALLKFAQNANTMVITHPNYPPQLLTLNSATNWTIAPIVFGTTVTTPTGTGSSTTLAAGNVNYAYCVTAVDANGQESAQSVTIALASLQDLRTTAGSISISWSAVTGATSYNVYKTELSYSGAVPSGAAFGFIGNCTGVSLVDSNIAPDFSLTPPIVKNPFAGAGLSSITITAQGSYTAVPAVIIGAPGGGGTQAAAQAIMACNGLINVNNPGTGYAFGDLINLPNGIQMIVTATTGPPINGVVGAQFTQGGSLTTTIPPNPVAQISSSGSGTGFTISLRWGVFGTTISNPGSGYGGAPAISFSLGGGATAVSTIGAGSVGNPGVPSYFQQKLVLAAPPGAVNTFYMSQPGSYFNFNISNPIEPDDSITGSIVANQLNTIKSMVAMPSGLIVMTDKAIWQINGGSAGSAVTPISIVANSQSYNGASDVPPIVADYDILYVQSKNSIVRDATYNFYTNNYTGTDISILSSHLFFGFQLSEWAWAQEPFKLVWAVRNDGTLLSLTYLKEQELIGWAHHDTQGLFQSVASVTETVAGNTVDAVYVVVNRNLNGQNFQYIERMADRYITNFQNPWCVDAGLQYNGTPATVFSGLDHLVGLIVTGLADGIPIPPQGVSAAGTITLAAPASLVTIGLPFLPQLQTLQLDLGEPTIQGKRKKITGVSVRCENTLGLSIGKTFDASSQVPMKDLVLGNLGSQTNLVVTDLLTGDAWTVIDPSWDVQGQYCIQQSLPYPSTILGVIPDIVVGDTK